MTFASLEGATRRLSRPGPRRPLLHPAAAGRAPTASARRDAFGELEPQRPRTWGRPGSRRSGCNTCPRRRACCPRRVARVPDDGLSLVGFLRAVLAQRFERVGHLEDVKLKLVRRVAGGVVEGVGHPLDAVLEEALGAAVDLLVEVIGVEGLEMAIPGLSQRRFHRQAESGSIPASFPRCGSGTAASSVSISAGASPEPVVAAGVVTVAAAGVLAGEVFTIPGLLAAIGGAISPAAPCNQAIAAVHPLRPCLPYICKMKSPTIRTCYRNGDDAGFGARK